MGNKFLGQGHTHPRIPKEPTQGIEKDSLKQKMRDAQLTTDLVVGILGMSAS